MTMICQTEKKTQHTRAVLETHIFDEKGMQHDISETIILQGGEQGWLLEHKHRHNLCRYKPKEQRQEQGGVKRKRKSLFKLIANLTF